MGIEGEKGDSSYQGGDGGEGERQSDRYGWSIITGEISWIENIED